jgi:hypothetical protein
LPLVAAFAQVLLEALKKNQPAVQASTALPSPQLTHRSTSAGALKSSLTEVWVTETVVSACQAFAGVVVNVPTGAVLSPGTTWNDTRRPPWCPARVDDTTGLARQNPRNPTRGQYHPRPCLNDKAEQGLPYRSWM